MSLEGVTDAALILTLASFDPRPAVLTGIRDRFGAVQDTRNTHLIMFAGRLRSIESIIVLF
jgi:hypothetical protein